MEKFKVGDILSPIKGKKVSNFNQISTIIRAEVVQLHNCSYKKYLVQIKLLEGYSGYYRVGKRLNVYNDGFELFIEGEQDYQIY
jgi:hypothetical protein